MRPFRETHEKGLLTIYTDGFRAYNPLGTDERYQRGAVIHIEDEYVDGNALQSVASIASLSFRKELSINHSCHVVLRLTKDDARKTNSSRIADCSNFARESHVNSDETSWENLFKLLSDSPTTSHSALV